VTDEPNTKKRRSPHFGKLVAANPQSSPSGSHFQVEAVLGFSAETGFRMPIGPTHETPQEAFEWIEEVGSTLFACTCNSVAVLNREDDVMAEWDLTSGEACDGPTLN